jgi:hypothetical protein
MLWGKKDEELPEALRGKTPEQIADALNKAAQLEQQVTDLTSAKTTAETTVTQLRSEFDTVKSKLDEMEANAQPKTPPTVNEPPSIWTDPQAYVQDQTKDTQNIALMSGMMSAKMYARQGLGERDAKIWRKYEKEIDGTMNGFTPQQKVLPQSWLLALTLVKGQHEQEIAQAERDGNDFFSEGPSRGAAPPPPTEDKLTPEEEEACRTFHWDPKGYLARKKQMRVNQSEKGGYASFPVPQRS